MNKFPWHMEAREHLEDLASKGATWDTIQMFYEKPSWCSHPTAIPYSTNFLDPEVGCKKLLHFNVRKEDDCNGCKYKEDD